MVLTAMNTKTMYLSGAIEHGVEVECIENFVQRYLTGHGNTMIAKIPDDATESLPVICCPLHLRLPPKDLVYESKLGLP